VISVNEGSKNPRPVFDAGSSMLRGLFHPCTSTIDDIRCRMISAMLNLG
jgi:hypothetical protein